MLDAHRVLLSTVAVSVCLRQCARRNDESGAECTNPDNISEREYSVVTNESIPDYLDIDSDLDSDLDLDLDSHSQSDSGDLVGLLPQLQEPTYMFEKLSIEKQASFLAENVKFERNLFVNSGDQKFHCGYKYGHLHAAELYSNEELRAPPDENARKKEYKTFYHGTTQSSVENIIQHGFIARHGDNGNMVGAGFYLTNTVNKADQYAGPINTLDSSKPSFFPMLLLGVDKKVYQRRVQVYLWRGESRDNYYACISGEDFVYHGKRRFLRHLRKYYSGRMIHVLAQRPNKRRYENKRADLIDRGNDLPEKLTWQPLLRMFDEYVVTNELIELITTNHCMRLEHVWYYKRCRRTDQETNNQSTITVGSDASCEALHCN
eukprot:TRINITY_DN31131_c0_g1_i1.p1 TRINITY_DN31131_c0_g1~~TRINITY_DN31131_c0_g1_i1.p1  ORF type:complete len:376 (-),score=10.44 TRINITY_DN31131_c0_g1_i1:370-1497(-)